MDKSKGRLRPVVLDPRGNPIQPPAIVEQLSVERREQYAKDRHEALMTMTPDAWRVFSLRWGLARPPLDHGGWDAHDLIVKMMHRVRLSTDSIPHAIKIESAAFCVQSQIPLPEGMTYDEKTRTLVGDKSDF